jgi:hypothetical protein
MRLCEQGCGSQAAVYGGGGAANDWAGYYCQQCNNDLGFCVFDYLSDHKKKQTKKG